MFVPILPISLNTKCGFYGLAERAFLLLIRQATGKKGELLHSLTVRKSDPAVSRNVEKLYSLLGYRKNVKFTKRLLSLDRSFILNKLIPLLRVPVFGFGLVQRDKGLETSSAAWEGRVPWRTRWSEFGLQPKRTETTASRRLPKCPARALSACPRRPCLDWRRSHRVRS